MDERIIPLYSKKVIAKMVYIKYNEIYEKKK